LFTSFVEGDDLAAASPEGGALVDCSALVHPRLPRVCSRSADQQPEAKGKTCINQLGTLIFHTLELKLKCSAEKPDKNKVSHL
jgi:hypothetical protein